MGVLGEAHLHGLKALWDSGKWRKLSSPSNDSDANSDVSSNSDESASTAFMDSSSCSDSPMTAQLTQEEATGVRHALLESAMRLKSVDSKFSSDDPNLRDESHTMISALRP